MTKAISVVGLGKLGAPMAACFAAKGFRVIGVDVDARKVEALNRGRAPVFEPGLVELLQAARDRLTATQDIEAAVAATDVTFVVVATPSEPGGGFSLRYVLPTCERIGQALRAKDSFHLVCLTSTVMPGTTGGPVRSTLERVSGKRCAVDFGLCYSPEFIALGSVIRDFMNPDFLLMGESDPRSGDILQAIYKQVCENTPALARMNFINAEIAKLAVNTYVTTKISFANMLARVCERLPEANVDTVTAALGLDSRIGPKYLKGAVSYGGPCFPRDNLALAALARQVGAPADIAQATDQFNRSQVAWLADLVQTHLLPNGTAGILGLTYKPNTDVVEEAVGLLLAQQLVSRGVPVVAYDPAGNKNSAAALDGKVRFADSARACIHQTDVVIVATPWQEFCALPPQEWARHSPDRTVIDCWRALKQLDGCDGIRYVSLGTGGILTMPNTSQNSQALAGKEIAPLTIFALPKAFRGHIGVIQRNAILNWSRLRPRPEIIMFGDDEGTAEIAQELGLRHVTDVARNEYGTPLLNELFEKAQVLASSNVLCYINADILLLDGFMEAVQRVSAWRDRFLMVGRRWDVDLDQPELYGSSDQEARLRALVLRQDRPLPPGAIDYFVFSRGLFGTIPPFAIGRGLWDNWLFWRARSLRAPVADASAVIFAVHQIHDYSHHPQGWSGVYKGEETMRNRELAGQRRLYTFEDATHKLTSVGIRRSIFPRLVKMTRPARQVLGLRRENLPSFLSKIVADKS